MELLFGLVIVAFGLTMLIAGAHGTGAQALAAFTGKSTGSVPPPATVPSSAPVLLPLGGSTMPTNPAVYAI